MALAPCLIGYGAIARRLYTEEHTRREGNRYWKWIENYVAEDYTEAVRLGSGKSPLRSSGLSSVVLISGRTARKPYAQGLAQPHGRAHSDLYPRD